MHMLVEQAMNGLQYSALLFLLSAGLTLIFGIMNVVNLAHGGFYAIGAYLAVTLAPRIGLQVVVVAHNGKVEDFPDARQVIANDAPVALKTEIVAGAFVVVATQGQRDLQGLRAALALRARKVFFVASARKVQVLRALLIEEGQDTQSVAAIVAPAGQAMGAATPEEIALSILAALVAERRGQQAPAAFIDDTPAISAAMSPEPRKSSVIEALALNEGACCCGGPSASTPPHTDATIPLIPGVAQN